MMPNMPAIKPSDALHLLYLSGADVDYESVSKTLAGYDAYELKPHCWLVRQVPDVNTLVRQMHAIFPKEFQKVQFLLAPLSKEMYTAALGGGDGLSQWLDKR
jgi:hypothetical protein